MQKLLLAVFVLGLAIPSQGADKAEKDGIKRDYVKRAVLTNGSFEFFDPTGYLRRQPAAEITFDTRLQLLRIQ